jgi:hypothetical protein
MNNIDNFSPETKSLLTGLYSYISKYDNSKIENLIFEEETKKLNDETFLIIDIIHEIRYDDIFIEE